jgi:hypothetical protein
MLLYSGFNSFFVMGTDEGASAFFLFWALILTIILLCGALSLFLGLFLDLGAKPYLTMFGWLGIVMGAHTILMFFADVFLYLATSSSEITKSVEFTAIYRYGSCFSLFILLGVGSFAINAVNGIESPRSWLYSLLLFVNLFVCTIVAGVAFYLSGAFALSTSPNSSDYSSQILSKRLVARIGVFQPLTYSRAMSIIRRINEQHEAQKAQRLAEEKQLRKQAQEAQARYQQEQLASLTPFQHAMYAINNAPPGPKFADALRAFIRDRATFDPKDFSTTYSHLLEKSSDKQLFLDICIDEHADALARSTYISMLHEAASQDAARLLIANYLFVKPAIGSSDVVIASYMADASLTQKKLNAATTDQKAAFLKNCYDAISSGAPGSENLVPLILGLADDKSRQDIYSLALQPGTNERALQAITDDWLARSPETFQDYFRIFFKIKGAGRSPSFEPQDLDTLSKVPNPDRRIQEHLAALLLSYCRRQATPQALAALSRWATPKTKLSIVDSLLSITTDTQPGGNDADFKIATALKLSEPFDQITELAKKDSWQTPAVLAYLRHDSLRAERSLLAAMDKKENRILDCESEIRLLEQVGWKTAKQRFILMYKFSKAPADRRRMSDAEAAISRQMAQTLRANPDDNPDKPKSAYSPGPAAPSSDLAQKPLAADTQPIQPHKAPATEHLQPPNPNDAKPAKTAAKVDVDDVVQIKSLGNLEYAIVTGTGSDLIPVTLINRANKKDYIPIERIIQIVGKADDQALITKLKAAGITPAADSPKSDSPQSPTAPAAPPKIPVAGTRVEVKMFGDWHPALIDRISGDQCFIIFEDKSIGDDWFGLKDIRPKGSKKSFLILSTE